MVRHERLPVPPRLGYAVEGSRDYPAQRCFSHVPIRQYALAPMKLGVRGQVADRLLSAGHNREDTRMRRAPQNLPL
jgi:hypothetical protein